MSGIGEFLESETFAIIFEQYGEVKDVAIKGQHPTKYFSFLFVTELFQVWICKSQVY